MLLIQHNLLAIGVAINHTLTLRKLASDLVVNYEGWVNEVMGAEEADFVKTDGFKAIYNRTSVAISVQQHRKINLLMKQNPAAWSANAWWPGGRHSA